MDTKKCQCQDASHSEGGEITDDLCDCAANAIRTDTDPFCKLCSDFATGIEDYIILDKSPNQCGCFDIDGIGEIPDSIFSELNHDCKCDTLVNELYTANVTNSKCECKPEAIPIDKG